MSKKENRKHFINYEKWFKTLLIKEFLNLPVREQQEFIHLTEKFLQDCRNSHKEAQNIREKVFQIKIEKILTSDTKKYTVIASIKENKVKIEIPASEPKPIVGKSITCILYSIDNQTWYYLKEKLIEETSTRLR